MLYANDRYRTSSAIPPDAVPVEPKHDALWGVYKSRLLRSGHFHGHVEGEAEYQGSLFFSPHFEILFLRCRRKRTKSNTLHCGWGTIIITELLEAGWQRYCDVCAYERTNIELSNPSRRCRVCVLVRRGVRLSNEIDSHWLTRLFSTVSSSITGAAGGCGYKRKYIRGTGSEPGSG
jgi:hypothetical protein